MAARSMPAWDVIVVGAGPAGTATANWCARQGLRVALYERARFPRHRPGETLPPGVEPIFGQLGVADAIRAAGFVRHAGTWVTWAGPRRFAPFGADGDGPWRGFQAPREELDRILLASAVQVGAAARQPCRVVRPWLVDGVVAGVETVAGPIAARWVVDAGGGAHWLARCLALPIQPASPRLIARYGYARGICPGGDDAPELVADAAGWTWTARIAPGRYHWTRLSLTRDDPWRDSPPLAFAAMTPMGPVRGADVTWRMVTRPAGPGYLCAGDAAAVLDPASSHGVLKALMSGMMAGHVIAREVAGTISATEAAQAYTDWLSAWFRADVAELTRWYGALPQPPAWVSDTDGAGARYTTAYRPESDR